MATGVAASQSSCAKGPKARTHRLCGARDRAARWRPLDESASGWLGEREDEHDAGSAEARHASPHAYPTPCELPEHCTLRREGFVAVGAEGAWLTAVKFNRRRALCHGS